MSDEKERAAGAVPHGSKLKFLWGHEVQSLLVFKTRRIRHKGFKGGLKCNYNLISTNESQSGCSNRNSNGLLRHNSQFYEPKE